MTSKSQLTSQAKFAWTCLILQTVLAILFFVLTRYGPSANAGHIENRLGHEHELERNVEKYPMMVDIHMMLFGGFGFLMTFLKRYGFSAVSLTMLITVVVTEWSILLFGLLRMGEEFTIEITFLEILEGSLTAAAVLISFGAVLGKLNPFQLLIMSLIECAVFVFNAHLGYSILGVVDIGGAIFIHMFGAYFGMAVSMVSWKKGYEHSELLEASNYISDILAMIGTVILWVFWPSFNAVLADDDAMHRAYINTYLSLIGSTVSTFMLSSFLDKALKFDMVDVQNATLAGGVAVGAVADLMLQPYGAFIAGSIVGLISTLGYRRFKDILYQRFRLHDTCGVHYLHGIPGFLSGLLSVLMCALASEDVYGPSLYLIFPRCSPSKVGATEKLQSLQAEIADIEPGDGRSLGMQALFQVIAIGITLIMAIVFGLCTGLILNVSSLFHPLEDDEFFDDSHYWPLEEGDLEEAIAEQKVDRTSEEDFDAIPSRPNQVGPNYEEQDVRF